MTYRHAFLKLCTVLALCLGLGISAAQADGSKTLGCPAGSRCNPVMEGWCRQNEAILSKKLSGKTLKPKVRMGNVSTVTNDLLEVYTYSSTIDCHSSFCCFHSRTDTQAALIGDIWDALKEGAARTNQQVKDARKGEYLRQIKEYTKQLKATTKALKELKKKLAAKNQTKPTDLDIDALGLSDDMANQLKEHLVQGDDTIDDALAVYNEQLKGRWWRTLKEQIAQSLTDFLTNPFLSGPVPLIGTLGSNAWDAYKEKKKAQEEANQKANEGDGEGGEDSEQASGETVDMPYFLLAILDKNNAAIDCWLCPLLERIFVIGDGLATRLYAVMRDGMLALVGVVTVLVMMWMIVKVFIDFTGKSARSFLQQLAGFLARVLIVALLLVQSPSFIGEWFLTPLINFSVGMSVQFMSGEDMTQSAHINYFNEHFNKEDNIMGCIHSTDFWQTNEDLLFPKTTCNTLVGLVQLISIELSTPIQYGQALIAYGWSDLKWFIFPRFTDIIAGAIMAGFFFILLIVVPFKVVDIFAQLACVGCLLPLAIVLFAFPTTRKYTQNMWQLFVACIIQLMVLALMASIVIAMFTADMSQSTNTSVLELFLEGKDKAAADALKMGGVGILFFIAMALLGWKLIGQAGAFAQQLGGALNLGLGQALSGAVGWATSRLGFVVGGASVLGVKLMKKKEGGGEGGGS